MPIMLRIGGKATRIAYRINGVPSNIAARKTAQQRALDQRIVSTALYRIK
jgi:hypothetical protein